MAKSEIEIAKLAIAQLNKRERAELFRPYHEGEAPTAPDQRLVRRSEAARLLARSCRGIDRIDAEGDKMKTYDWHQ